MIVANLVAFHEIPFPDWVARRVMHQCFHPVLAMPLEWASHEAALTQPWWRCPAWTGSPVCQSLCTLLAFLRRNYPGVSEVERRIAPGLPQYLVAASVGGNVVILETAGGWRLPTQYYGSERGFALPHGILNEATKTPYDRFPVRVTHLVNIYEFHSLGHLWAIIVRNAHTGADMARIQLGPTSTIEQLCLASPQFHRTI